jgi:hypothetical protein
VTVFDVAAGSVMALTASVPSPTGESRISIAVPFVMPVRTVIPRMVDPSYTHRVPQLAAPAQAGAAPPGKAPSLASIAAVGLKRRAADGTMSASARRATSMVTVAVIPGFSFSSGFSTSMTVA